MSYYVIRLTSGIEEVVQAVRYEVGMQGALFFFVRENASGEESPIIAYAPGTWQKVEIDQSRYQGATFSHTQSRVYDRLVARFG